MDGTSARLRKTFRYPQDNSSDDSLPLALDEEGTVVLYHSNQCSDIASQPACPNVPLPSPRSLEYNS